MNDDLRDQIRNTMSLKETGELLDIWVINNRAVWSDEAFEVVGEILKERGEELPEPDDPVYEPEDKGEPSNYWLEDWESKVLDYEDQPEFYSVTDVISLNRNITKLSKAAVGIYAFLGILNIRLLFSPGSSGPITLSSIVQHGFDIVAIIFNVGLRAALIYYPLKALAQILRLLTELEFRSRKVD